MTTGSFTFLFFSGDRGNDLHLKTELCHMLSGYSPQGFPANIVLLGGFKNEKKFLSAFDDLSKTSYKLLAVIEASQLGDDASLILARKLVAKHDRSIKIIVWSKEAHLEPRFRHVGVEFIKIAGKSTLSDRAWLLCKLVEFTAPGKH
jgi:hypothetical protein